MNKKEISRKNSKRTMKQLMEHYIIEKKLASRLRMANKTERQYLYTNLYEKLFQNVPDHPQLTQKRDYKLTRLRISRQMRLVKRFLTPESTFLEIGPGDCSLSIGVAKYVKFVYAIDVSREITKGATFPKNFSLIISKGDDIPVPENSINVAYSNHLMEHLHPDDATEQLNSTYKSLASGGVYICITPNRISGPHDISKYFDDVATGFHMKEYTVSELQDIFFSAGFSKIITYVGGRGVYMRFPAFLIKSSEKLIQSVPQPLKKVIAGFLPIKALLGAIIVGKKRLD